MALRALLDYFRDSSGVGINGASYTITRLSDNAVVASGSTAADAEPATALAGKFETDEATLGYGGPVKYVVTGSGGTRVHTSKSVGLVGAWRTLDVTRIWRLHGKGVVPGIGSELAVTTNGTNMVISVAAGEYLAAIADHGLFYAWTVARTLTATTADATNPRIDTVVLRCYPPGVVEEGRIDLVLRAGTPAGSPAAVGLHQSTDYWEEALADVRVDAGVTALATNKVTDRRTYQPILPSTMTNGDLFYVNSGGKLAQLAGNTTATKKYLSQTGDGTNSAAPAWGVVAAADLPTAIDAAKIADGSVSNTKFQYLGGVTSDVQTQLGTKQPLDATLTAVAGAVTAADKLIYWTGADVAGVADFTAAGRALVDDADAATQRATLGLVIGTDVEAHDADLTTIAGLTPTNDDVIQRKAGAWTNRTMAQVKTDLVLAKGDVGLGNVDNTSDATKNAASVTLANKTIDNTNTATIKDANFTIQDDADTTKQAKFQASGITTGTTRTLTLPNATTTLLGSGDIGGSVQGFAAVLDAIKTTGLGFLGDYLVFASVTDAADYTNGSTATNADAATTTIALGTGTWTLWGIAGILASHSANGATRIAVSLDGTDSASLLSGNVTGTAQFVVVASQAGVATGTKTVKTRFRPGTSGTVTVDTSWLFVVAIRTA